LQSTFQTNGTETAKTLHAKLNTKSDNTPTLASNAALMATYLDPLLLFNVGGNEVTAGELKSRGDYQGSNFSYNLKKLVDNG
jgi:hypothetical protein